MKTVFSLIILMVFLSACRNDNKSFKNPPISSMDIPIENTIVKYDTIVIDYDLENKKREQRNLLYDKLTLAELIDSLKQLSELQGIMEINEDGLPFNDFENISRYYVNNIPIIIYQKIFSDEIIKTERKKFTNIKVDDKEEKVTIQKGLKITQDRKFKTLLSLIEKENYIQLLLTKHGKYQPEVELVTVSKKEFSPIDNLSLLGGIYDSYDIHYWHSKFTSDYEEIRLTKVMNLKFNTIELDTTITNYGISKNGEILEK